MDLSFKFGNDKLNIRVGALIIKDGKLLIAHSARPYWHTIGGRIHLGESSEQAVVRECLEETGQQFEIDRLAYVTETFFNEEASGNRFHEMCFYYFMKPNGTEDLIGTTFSEGEETEKMGWFDIETLDEVDLRPSFLAKELNNVEDGIKHITLIQ